MVSNDFKFFFLMLIFSRFIGASNINICPNFAQVQKSRHNLLISQIVEHIDTDINKLDRRGETFLFRAILIYDVEIVAFLLGNGADPNIRNENGGSCLPLAVQCENTEIVRLLLQYGAAPNSSMRRGWPALALACELGNAGMVRLLLEHNADPNINIKALDGQTPLELAVERRYANIVEFLLEYGADPNIIRWRHTFTMLTKAIIYENERIVELLLANGADPNLKISFCSPPLHHAVRRGHKGIIKLLLANGADPSGKNRRGNTIAIANNEIKKIFERFSELLTKPETYEARIRKEFMNTQFYESRLKNLPTEGTIYTALPDEIWIFIGSFSDRQGLIALSLSNKQVAKALMPLVLGRMPIYRIKGLLKDEGKALPLIKWDELFKE